MSAFVPPSQCPQCKCQIAVQVPDQNRTKLVCTNCSEVLAILVIQPWVRLEILPLLEMGDLSDDDRKFLARIAKKTGLGALTDREFARLVKIQNSEVEQ